MKPFPLRLLFVTLAFVVLPAGAVLVACGSNQESPAIACDGPCDGGAAESASGGQDSSADGLVPADGAIGSDGGAEASVPPIDAGPCGPFDAGPGGVLQWGQTYGLTGQTGPSALAVDPVNEDIVVVGHFQGTVNFGGGIDQSISAVGATDGFIARYNKAGDYKWSKAFGTGGYVGITAVGVDGAGNVDVGGRFQGALDLGGAKMTAVGNSDGFVASFDTLGKHRWSKSFGATGADQLVYSGAVDGAGNFLVSSFPKMPVDYGGGPRTGFVIVKYDATGGHVWSKGFATVSTTYGPKLAVDTAGDVFLGGMFATTLDFGGAVLTTSLSRAIGYLAKFDSSGAYRWSKKYENPPNGRASFTALAVDCAGNVAIAGDFVGTMDFGSGSLVAPANAAYTYVAKLDSTGAGVWSGSFNFDNNNRVPPAIALDRAGRPTVGLVLDPSTSFDFGGGPIGSASVATSTLVLVALDETGKHRWSRGAGPPSTATASLPVAMVAAGDRLVLAADFGRGSCGVASCGAAPPGTTMVLSGKTFTAGSIESTALASITP